MIIIHKMQEKEVLLITENVDMKTYLMNYLDVHKHMFYDE